MTHPAVSTPEPAAHPVHHVPGLSFSDDTVEKRRQTLGASEVPAVAGLNAHRTALDVYLDKVGAAPPFVGNQFTEWGLRLEEPIAQKYAEVKRATLQKSEQIVHRSEPWMSCTPDRIVVENGFPVRGVEIKRFGDYREEEFGAVDTDEVPADVAIQCHWSMLVTGLSEWDIAVLLGQAEFRTYRLRATPEVSSMLYDIGRRFWFENVVARVQPEIDGSASAKRFLSRAFDTHGPHLIDATAEQLLEASRLADLRDEHKHLELEIDTIENRLKLAVGEHAGIRGICTWKLDKTGRPQWKAIAESLGAKDPKHRALIERYTSAPSRRFLFTYSEG